MLRRCHKYIYIFKKVVAQLAVLSMRLRLLVQFFVMCHLVPPFKLIYCLKKQNKFGLDYAPALVMFNPNEGGLTSSEK